MKYDLDKSTVCVVGLGYVGLPLAQAFARGMAVIGFDVSKETIREINKANDNPNLTLTTDPKQIGRADFIIICVPTPVTKSKEPDLSYVRDAASITAKNMKQGSVVILESSVYPGVTEDIVKPILEQSGFECGKDFKIAYSPERVNPGDKEHTIDQITKVVAGMDEETTQLVAELYQRAVSDVFIAKNIKTAEAAKIIENAQRDLNIALMNELSLIFEKLGIDTEDVLDAAATKWNFHRYSPGLVGGHCIPVDPYYLVYKARGLGYHPQVILAGRAINDYMAKHIAQVAIILLNSVGKVIKDSKVLIMGLSYKENVADTREAPIVQTIKELKEYGVDILGYDPLLKDIESEFGITAVNNLRKVKGVDCIIMAVAHSIFDDIRLDDLKRIMGSNPVLIDVRAFFNKEEALEKGFHYKRL